VKGATRFPVSAAARARFNPRAREGRDHDPAPTHQSLRRFNPRAREGRDMAASQGAVIAGFQSTRP